MFLKSQLLQEIGFGWTCFTFGF